MNVKPVHISRTPGIFNRDVAPVVGIPMLHKTGHGVTEAGGIVMVVLATECYILHHLDSI